MEPLTDNDLRLIEEQIPLMYGKPHKRVIIRLVDSLREARTLLSEERHKVKRLEEKIHVLELERMKRGL